MLEVGQRENEGYMLEVGQRENQGYTVELGSLVMDEPVVS